MARNQIFISYSRQDEKLFQEFCMHLKPWQDRGIVTVWTDQRLQASQDWHSEIQQAIASAAVAVLLISPAFMASAYIRQYEIPPLLQAAETGELCLAPLYLRPSQVTDEDYAFVVRRHSGEPKRVKLSDYHSLNRPEQTPAGMRQPQRDKLFASAAQQLKQLIEDPLERVRQVNEIVEQLRNLPAMYTNYGLAVHLHKRLHALQGDAQRRIPCWRISGNDVH